MVGRLDSTSGAPLTTERIVAEYGAYVFRALRYLGVPERDLADVCQETFVVVHRKLPEFEARASLRTWLYQVCRRTASDYRRRAHVRRETVHDFSDDRTLHAPSSTAALEARQLLLRALDTLDEDKREVFVLSEVEGLTMTEVVAIVGCPLQTAYSRLHAARKRIEEFIRHTQQGAA